MGAQMIKLNEVDYEDVLECYQANLDSQAELNLFGLHQDLASRKDEDFAYKIVEAIKEGTLIAVE